MDMADFVEMGGLLVMAACIAVIAYLIFIPFFSGENKTNKRVAAIREVGSGSKVRSAAGGNGANSQKRRQQVQKVLDELEHQKKEDKNVSLSLRMERAGLVPDTTRFYLMSVVSAVVATAGLYFAMGPNPFMLAATFGVFLVGFPRFVLNKMAQRRQKKFLAEFANAIDVIVRGIRSGLPLNDCLSIISDEIPDPVGSEFGLLIDQIRVGIPIGAAFEKMYKRIPVQEVNFFSIVIAIQQKSGGNLAEALSNLSAVLRDRKRLQAKVQSFSSEAKSSAAIIGSLPLFVMGIVYLTTPDYIEILFTTSTGHFLLMCSAGLMLMGVLIMRKMINFDY